MTVVSTGEADRREDGEKRIKFNSLKGFVAVEEKDSVWELYFDVDNYLVDNRG